MSKELDKQYNPVNVEGKWYDFWIKKGYFRAATDSTKPPYSIVIPPPNITGSLHMGHALNNTLQDILIRWKRMDGYNTLWMPGTDHAGIATQNVVEKQLKGEGIDRHTYGREKFIKRVWEWKERSGGEIINQLKRLGASCDWDRERFTMDEGLSQAVRELFVLLYNEGLIYKGPYIINWCPRCSTALSDLEVEHEDINGQLYYVKYQTKSAKSKSKKGGGDSLIIATTRPETILGDTAVAVHPDDPRYKNYIGASVLLPLVKREIPVIADSYVSMEFGTGALKITPAHDPNDFEVGKRHNIPSLKVIDDNGIMNENAGKYSGLDRFECRKAVVASLMKASLLVKVEDIKHAVGHCYRCKTIIEPSLSTQWFVKTKGLSEAATKAVENGDIKIIPKPWENTYFEWMRNIKDWCISRQIWWGHRIPVWYCKDCNALTVSTVDPSCCAKCSSINIFQDSDVLDTWFSSGIWPFSTMGWPGDTKELKLFYPTSTLVTGFDILFFWIARMIMLGIKVRGEVPFKNVYIHALVRDAEGKKMSKSKGNVIDPLIVMEKYGTDAFRFTLAAFAAQGRDIKLSEERIEGYRHFANKIWNASRFLLMNLSGFDDTVSIDKTRLSLADIWIVSRLQKAILEVRNGLEHFRFNDAAAAIYQFVWHEFCDWYIEMVKSRLREEGDGRTASQHVMLKTLDSSLKLLHPFMPFITEEIWQIIPHTGESIMISEFPKYNADLVTESAEKDMQLIMRILDGIRNIRGEMNIAPSKKLDVIVNTANKDKIIVLNRESKIIYELGLLNSLNMESSGVKPKQSATSVIDDDIEIFIPLQGVLDFKEEEERLRNDLTKVRKDLAIVNKQLSNREFTSKAPPEVILKNEERLKLLKEKEEKLVKNLSMMTMANI